MLQARPTELILTTSTKLNTMIRLEVKLCHHEATGMMFSRGAMINQHTSLLLYAGQAILTSFNIVLCTTGFICVLIGSQKF